MAAATESATNLCVVNSPKWPKTTSTARDKNFTQRKIKLREKKIILNAPLVNLFSFVRSCVAFLDSFVRFLLAYVPSVRFSNLCVFVEGRIYCLSFYLGYRSMSFSATNVAVYNVVAFSSLVRFFFIAFRFGGSVRCCLFLFSLPKTRQHVIPFNFFFRCCSRHQI